MHHFRIPFTANARRLTAMIEKSPGVLLVVVLLLQSVQWTSQRSVADLKTKVFQSHACNRMKSSGKANVFLTVSSLVSSKKGKYTSRLLEINWNGRKPQPGDQVGLFNADPTILGNYKSPLVSVDPADHQFGYYRTEVEFPSTAVNVTDLPKTTCLGYWAGYSINGSLTSSSCLRIRPYWMHDNKVHLQDFKLSEVMIPGSHDSGSYEKADESDEFPKRYVYAQEESIYNQLVYGIRYFDLRVGNSGGEKGEFYIYHNFYGTDHLLTDVLTQVTDFMNATKEIVLLDFHNFPMGFKNETHLQLIQLLHKFLGPYMIPKKDAENPTFGEVWNGGRHLLVAYNDEMRSHSEFLCPEIAMWWGDKATPDSLEEYFKVKYSGPIPNNMWASMAEITPTTLTIFGHPQTGLRKLADLVNRNVTRWFRDLYWQKANIIATDYVLGNNIVEVAIDTNKIRSSCWKKFKSKKHVSAYFGRIV